MTPHMRPQRARAMRLLVTLGALLVATGCGRPFDVKTGQDFAELKKQKDEGYDYRAMTPEGVAVSVRAIENETHADLGFWSKGVLLKLREQDGYALLGEDAVQDQNGTPGKRLRFARDEDKKVFDYWVTLYLAQGRVFVVESGGARAAFEKAKPTVERMERSVTVRCKSLVAPVLASRTCNRW